MLEITGAAGGDKSGHGDSQFSVGGIQSVMKNFRGGYRFGILAI